MLMEASTACPLCSGRFHESHARDPRRRTFAGAGRRAYAQSARLAASGAMRPLRTVLPAVTCTVQSTLLTGPAAAPARRGRQRLVLPRPRRGLALAAVEPPGIAARRSGRPGRRRDPRFTCAKMFWWYNMYSRPTGAPRRGRCIPPTAARSPTITPTRPSCATSSNAQARPVPAVQVLGAGHRHLVEPSGSPTRRMHVMRDAQADAHARLPAAPRLQPAAPRARPRRIRACSRTCGEVDARVRRADRVRPSADGARVIVVSEYGITPVRDAGAHQPRAARGRA